jgi:hypothetical protein
MPNKTYKEELEESFYKECGEWCGDPFNQIADWWIQRLESYADKRVENLRKELEESLTKWFYATDQILDDSDLDAFHDKTIVNEMSKQYIEELFNRLSLNTKTLSDEVEED